VGALGAGLSDAQVAQQPGMARVRKTGIKFTKEELWAYLLECDQQDYVMVLATGGKDEMTETGADRSGGGVVDGHAYSLNTVVECGHFRLCQVASSHRPVCTVLYTEPAR
jgi:hypothetical protein